MWIKQGVIFNKHWAQLPIVDTENKNFWRIYYSHRIDNKSYPKYIDIEKENPKNIIFEQKEPILNLGKLGSFDQAGVMPTEIINYNNKKYLYYIGWSNRKDVPYFNTLGLAISEDNGKTYNKFSTGPVFGSSYKEPGYIGTTKILIENGIWRAWYLSCREWEIINGIVEPIYDIKYAESTNGIDWDPKNISCINLQGAEGGISQASVLKQDNKYYMWFSYRAKTNYRLNKNYSYRIGMAMSDDGIEWQRKETLELDASEQGWDSIMVEYPYVVTGIQNYFMFYNGNGFGKEGIGYAIKQNTFSMW
jgi:hypothetical protein